MFRESYGKLVVVKRKQTERAILVEYEDELAWVPHSLFGKGSGREIERAELNEEVTVYIPEWKLRDLGWDMGGL